MISFKKVYGIKRSDDRVVLPDSHYEYECVMTPVKVFNLKSIEYDVLMGREEAEKFCKARPDIFKMKEVAS